MTQFNWILVNNENHHKVPYTKCNSLKSKILSRKTGVSLYFQRLHFWEILIIEFFCHLGPLKRTWHFFGRLLVAKEVVETRKYCPNFFFNVTWNFDSPLSSPMRHLVTLSRTPWKWRRCLKIVLISFFRNFLDFQLEIFLQVVEFVNI